MLAFRLTRHPKWRRGMNTLPRHSNTLYTGVLYIIITLAYRLYSFWLLIKTLQKNSDTPHSVGLLWTSAQPDAETSTWQHTTLTRDRHPWLRRDLNPQSQQARGRRPKYFLSKINSVAVSNVLPITQDMEISVFLTRVLHKHNYKISLKHTCVIDKHTEQTLFTRQWRLLQTALATGWVAGFDQYSACAPHYRYCCLLAARQEMRPSTLYLYVAENHSPETRTPRNVYAICRYFLETFLCYFRMPSSLNVLCMYVITHF